MKILCLSLLRLGDIVQHRWLLKGLRQRYPSAELHLLVHDEFNEVAGLVPEATKVHFFPKTEMQAHLNDPRSPLLFSHQRLTDFVGQLNAESWTLVYNFTHNRQSAFLMELIKADRKRGLRTHAGKMAGLDNPWIRFFNRHFSSRYPIHFHYLELLAKSLEISLPNLPNLSFSNRRPVVLFQLDSADSKKTIEKQRMVSVLDDLAEKLPKYELRVLSDERNAEENQRYFSSRVWVGGLRETSQQVQVARALVTLDTSIKHLACHHGTPLLEISLGSSDPDRTAAWLSGAKVISGVAPCRPCGHREVCSQPQHLCSQSISAEILARAIENILDHREDAQLHQVLEGPLGLQIEGGIQSKAYVMFKKWLYHCRIEGQDLVSSLGPQFKKICYSFSESDLVRLASEMEAEYHGFLHVHLLAQNVSLFDGSPAAYQIVDAAAFLKHLPNMLFAPWWQELNEKIEKGHDWAEIESLSDGLLRGHLAVRAFLSKMDVTGGNDVRSAREKADWHFEAARKA